MDGTVLSMIGVSTNSETGVGNWPDGNSRVSNSQFYNCPS